MPVCFVAGAPASLPYTGYLATVLVLPGLLTASCPRGAPGCPCRHGGRTSVTGLCFAGETSLPYDRTRSFSCLEIVGSQELIACASVRFSCRCMAWRRWRGCPARLASSNFSAFPAVWRHVSCCVVPRFLLCGVTFPAVWCHVVETRSACLTYVHAHVHTHHERSPCKACWEQLPSRASSLATRPSMKRSRQRANNQTNNRHRNNSRKALRHQRTHVALAHKAGVAILRSQASKPQKRHWLFACAALGSLAHTPHTRRTPHTPHAARRTRRTRRMAAAIIHMVAHALAPYYQLPVAY